MSEKFRNKYRIKSARLQGWDYSSEGGYYITICTKYRKSWFGNCINQKMELSETGRIVNDLWYEIPKRNPVAILDEFVVMPNHIHGILFINHDNAGGGIVETCHGMSLQRFGKPIKNSVSMIFNHYKGDVTKTVCQRYPDFQWQSRFHDHIIRNDDELNRIRKYIIENPEKWKTDENFTYISGNYGKMVSKIKIIKYKSFKSLIL